MKKSLFIITFVAFGALIAQKVAGQDIVTGGNMENADAWLIANKGEPTADPEYTFNYQADAPLAGVGGCLLIHGSMDPGGANAQIDSYLYQEVTLAAGTTYKLLGAFKDISQAGVYNFWCEIGLSLDPPEESESITYMVGINTWEGCGPELDGTFQDDYCKYGGPFFKVPADPPGDVIYYLSILTGMWDNSNEHREFDVLLDEISLVDSASIPSGISEINIAQNSITLSNAPNPFSVSTSISYTLPGNYDVLLTVYNMLGEEIAVLVNETQLKGTYNIYFDGSELKNGLYYYSLKTNNNVISKRMILFR